MGESSLAMGRYSLAKTLATVSGLITEPGRSLGSIPSCWSIAKYASNSFCQ